MLSTGYFLALVALLTAMGGAIAQMGAALDEADLDRFSVWTCVAAVIAFIPAVL